MFAQGFAALWIVVAIVIIAVAAYAVGTIYLKNNAFEYHAPMGSEVVEGDASTGNGRFLNRFVNDVERQFMLTEDGPVMNAQVQIWGFLVGFLRLDKHRVWFLTIWLVLSLGEGAT